MAGMFNIWDATQKRHDARQQVGLDYASMPEGRVAVGVLGQTASGLGGGMMKAAGFSNPDEERQKAIMAVRDRFPNPQTAEDFRNLGNALAGIDPDLAKLAFDQIGDLTDKSTEKKWQDTKKSKIIDIRAEALRRGYKLPEDIIRSIANSSPDVSQVSNTTDTFIHPWMNALEAQLAGRKQYEGFMSGTAESTPASQATDTTPEKRAAIELDRAETMRTKYNTEVADYKTNFESASSGLVNVKLHREGNNQSALPNITKNLAQMFNDKKLSQPEVKHAMSFGGLGERVVRKFSLWMSGELPPGDLNDIEEMFRRVALVSQQQMNAKTVDFRTRYGDKMSKKNLNSFLPAIATIPLTQQQRLEALKEQKRLRGI